MVWCRIDFCRCIVRMFDRITVLIFFILLSMNLSLIQIPDSQHRTGPLAKKYEVSGKIFSSPHVFHPSWILEILTSSLLRVAAVRADRGCLRISACSSLTLMCTCGVSFVRVSGVFHKANDDASSSISNRTYSEVSLGDADVSQLHSRGHTWADIWEWALSLSLDKCCSFFSKYPL